MFLRGLVSRARAVAVAVVVAVLVMPTIGLAAVTKPPLGTAGNYALVANTTITNTGVTLINGNLALVGPSATGFGPGVGVVTGRSDIGNAAADRAAADVLTAHHAATAATPVTEMAGDLGGLTLFPGVYHIGAGATIGAGETLTLNGQGQSNPVFIFQIGSTLTTGTAARVRLTNRAAGCSVFWAVGSSATLGTGTSLQGNLMALVSITMTTGATIGVGGGRNGGRAFAQNGAITLDTNQIMAPRGSCATGPAPTPPPTPSRRRPHTSPDARSDARSDAEADSFSDPGPAIAARRRHLAPHRPGPFRARDRRLPQRQAPRRQAPPSVLGLSRIHPPTRRLHCSSSSRPGSKGR